jgi:hypothetical protein
MDQHLTIQGVCADEAVLPPTVLSSQHENVVHSIGILSIDMLITRQL